MRYRTAVKTGRTAAMQTRGLRTGSFVHYAAMVDRLCAGYIRPLALRGSSRSYSRVTAA